MSPTDPTIPQQSSTGVSSTNRVVKKKFWTKSRVAMAAVGVAIASYFLYATLDLEDFFDSERPPIIVNSGGSVDFDIHWHWKGQGEWKKQIVGIENVFEHQGHPNAKPATIDVTPKKYDSCVDSNTGANASPPFTNAKRVDITYGDGKLINETTTINVGVGEYLTASFPTAPTASATTLTAHYRNKEVWIREMVVGTIKCTFPDDKGSIKVKQRK